MWFRNDFDIEKNGPNGQKRYKWKVHKYFIWYRTDQRDKM